MFGLRRSVSALAASRSRGSSALCGKVRAFSADSVAAPAAKALQEMCDDPARPKLLHSSRGAGTPTQPPAPIAAHTHRPLPPHAVR